MSYEIKPQPGDVVFVFRPKHGFDTMSPIACQELIKAALRAAGVIPPSESEHVNTLARHTLDEFRADPESGPDLIAIARYAPSGWARGSLK